MRVVFKKAYFYLLLLYAPGFIALVLFVFTSNIKFKDYIKHRYPIKEAAIDWNARLQMSLLGHTNNGSVHFGKDSWLFYITQGDGSSYNDFWGIGDPMLVRRWQEYLNLTVLKPYGFTAKYLLVLPPNKESVYPEKTRFLFNRSINRRLGNYERVIGMIRAEYSNIFVDIKNKLIEGKEKYPTYYSADTHWNQWGAYIAHLEILRRAEVVLQEPIDALPLEEPREIPSGQKDIYDMIAHNAFLRKQVSVIAPDISIQLKSACSHPLADDKKEYTVYECPGKKFVVWFIGDSFSDRMKPFLSLYFRKTIFMRYNPFGSNSHIQRALRDGGVPDLIIDEKVERFLPRVSAYKDYAQDLTK